MYLMLFWENFIILTLMRLWFCSRNAMQFYGVELWYNSLNCTSTMKKFEVGFHKAIKKIVRWPNYVSNHYVCNLVNLFTFKHYIDWIKTRFVYKLIKSENILISLLNDFFVKDSFIFKDIEHILESDYNVVNFMDNGFKLW